MTILNRLWAAVTIMLMSLCFTASAAAETTDTAAFENGVRVVSEEAEALGGQYIGDVPIGGLWQVFSWRGPLPVTAFGCRPADPGGLGCFIARDSEPADTPPWTFEAGLKGAILTVTDVSLLGDVFEVFDSDNFIGSTSVVARAPPFVSCGVDPIPCLDDPRASSGFFVMEPGSHAITLVVDSDSIFFGAAYFRVDPTRLKARLGGPAIDDEEPSGSADWRLRVDRDDGDPKRISVAVEDINLPAGTVLSVMACNTPIGTITLEDQEGDLNLDERDGDIVPFCVTGHTATVFNGNVAILSGGLEPKLQDVE